MVPRVLRQQFARVAPTIAVIFGGAGMSKTTTARRYVGNPGWDDPWHAYYVSAARWIKSPTAILREIADAIDMTLALSAYRNESFARGILNKLKPGDLLIIDEAQHLDADALDGIRYFHDEESINDLMHLVSVALDLARTAQELGESADELASSVQRRMEVAPAPGDRLQAETMLQMFQAIIGRGEGFSAYRLAGIASVLGAHANLDQELRPVFDLWIEWMASIGIKTFIDHAAVQLTGGLCVGITAAPGGADAIIRPGPGSR